jgi:6-phosphogluconolactonase
MPVYTYVALSGEDRVAVYENDPTSGRLEARGDHAVAGGPYPLAVNPDRRFLYVGRVGDREISSFKIDPSSGGLSPIGSVAIEEDPCFLATDRTGGYLLSAYYFAGNVGVHRIDEDGAVVAPPIEWIETGPGAHSAQTDPSNRFAFAPSIAQSHGPNLVFQFRFDDTTGRLTPNSPYSLSPDNRAGPRHFCFHPSKDVVYFSNEQGCSVTAYGLDRSAGTLTAMQTVSTLPDGFIGENSCSQIQISPTGRSLYAPNRGHDSVAVFAIDDTSGLLDRVQIEPTEPTPRALSLEPDGNFLYVAGESSGKLASYRVDSPTGMIEPMELYDVGEAPMWVLMTRVG